MFMKKILKYLYGGEKSSYIFVKKPIRAKTKNEKQKQKQKPKQNMSGIFFFFFMDTLVNEIQSLYKDNNKS